MKELPYKPSYLGIEYRFCPVCRVHIHIENVHTRSDCILLRCEIIPERSRIVVPDIFQEALNSPITERVVKQGEDLCECGNCGDYATMHVQIRPESKMVLCDFHTGEMISWVVRAQDGKKDIP